MEAPVSPCVTSSDMAGLVVALSCASDVDVVISSRVREIESSASRQRIISLKKMNHLAQGDEQSG